VHVMMAGQQMLEVRAHCWRSPTTKPIDYVRAEANLQGHVRVFATIDIGQRVVTRRLARFLSDHPRVTAELGYTNRPGQSRARGAGARVDASAPRRAAPRRQGTGAVLAE